MPSEGWRDRQKKVFTNWINNKLKERIAEGKIAPVFDVNSDLKNGFVLYHLLEVLSKTSMRPYGKLSKGRMKIQHIANLSVDFKYINSNIKTVGIGPQDVYDGNQRLILGLIWSVICFFTLKEFQELSKAKGADADGDGAIDITEFKKHLMGWAGDCLGRLPSPGVPVGGLKDTFADGKAFLGILHAVAPEKHAYDPSDDPCDNMARAFERAEEEYGVPQLLDPTDPHSAEDENSVVTYLAELEKALPEPKLAPPPPPPPALSSALAPL